VQSDVRPQCKTPLAEHLDQALLLLDERVAAGGLPVKVVGDGALLVVCRDQQREVQAVPVAQRRHGSRIHQVVELDLRHRPMSSLAISRAYGKASGGALLWVTFDRMRSLRGR